MMGQNHSGVMGQGQCGGIRSFLLYSAVHANRGDAGRILMTADVEIAVPVTKTSEIDGRAYSPHRRVGNCSLA
jgi:hypothetical protein